MNLTLLSQAVEATVSEDRVVPVLLSIIASLLTIVVGQLVLMLKGDIITRKWHMERLADRDLVSKFWEEEALRNRAIVERVLGTTVTTNKILDKTEEYIAPVSSGEVTHET